MEIASCVSYAMDEITRLAYGDYPCEIALAVNVLNSIYHATAENTGLSFTSY